MLSGAFTALITPFSGDAVDYHGLERLVAFQVENGIDGILAVGTTGESPVLTWEEHNAVVEKVAAQCQGRSICIAGTGSNNTKEALNATEHAAKAGASAALLVDPYYNGPSSLEIRREYLAPVARSFPQMEMIPYVIPGRTGTQLMPEDLAILHQEYPNVSTVKEATANLDNMRRTRACCGPDFTILSGDDGMTFAMMADERIRAAGVISVTSNIAPKAVSDMVRLMGQGRESEAEALMKALSPFFGLVTVKTTEQSRLGPVACRARNPLPIKALMALLGMPSGGARPPLGRMTQQGMEQVLEVVRTVWKNHPEVLQPVEAFFGVDIEARIHDPELWKPLCYEEY